MGVLDSADWVKFHIYTTEAAPYLELAAEVRFLPDALMERTLVLAGSLIKSNYDLKPALFKKIQAPFLNAVVARFPAAEQLLRDVRLAKVFESSSMGGSWPTYEKALKIVETVEGIDCERYCLAVLDFWLKPGTEDAHLYALVSRCASSRSAFIAYREATRTRDFYRDKEEPYKWRLSAKLQLKGELVEGCDELHGLQVFTLYGHHTSDRHVSALAKLEPFALNYLVSAPNLANMLPASSAVQQLILHKKCKDYRPLEAFKELKVLSVVKEDLPQVFKLFGHIPTLKISDLSNSSSPDGIAALRKQYMG
jgi:hypothetical protein